MKAQDELRQTMLTMMIEAFRKLEQRLPTAVMTNTVVGPHMRFREQSPAQAVLQKLARLISGLTALKLLHDHGMLQEQAVIQRTIDEIDEDITFICIAEIQQDYTDLHRRYLSDFWLEEFDNADVAQSSFKRGLVPRDKIRSYNIRMNGDEDPSTANANLRALYKSYSGYVHAASPQVMDMCLGDPPLFQLQGTKNVYRLRTSYDDAWNYYYRGYAVTCIATMAFGAKEDREWLMSFMRHVESIAGI